MLIDVEKMRMFRTNDPEVKFKLVRQNLERFFRDYLYYYNVYDRDELIIDAGYLPFHYLDEQVLNKVIRLLEEELGYAIIIVKITNTNQIGYQKNDLINIRLFDTQTASVKDVDDYFNLKMFQPIYSTLHSYYNIDGNTALAPYLSCLDTSKGYLLENNQKAIGDE